MCRLNGILLIGKYSESMFDNYFKILFDFRFVWDREQRNWYVEELK